MKSRLRRIVLVSLDAVRFDATAAQPDRSFWYRYGVEPPRTPTLDQFAHSGTFFRQAITTAPYTTTAHASLFTGRIPPRHGIRAFYRNALPASIPTLAEQLGTAGFDTCFLSDRPELFEPLGLTRGFTHHADADSEWLATVAAGDRPLVAFAHLFDAHKPYLVAGAQSGDVDHGDCFEFIRQHSNSLGLRLPGFDNPIDAYWGFQSALRNHPDGLRTLLRMYAAGIERFDATRLTRFADLLTDATFLRDSLVLVFSDHGEDRVPGQVLDHGGDLTDGKIRVFLSASGPDWLAGASCDALCSLTDLFPTCLRAAGVDDSAGLIDGCSLGSRRDGSAPLTAAYVESWNYQSDESPDRPQQGPLAGHNWMLHQRGFRTVDRLWVRRGLPLAPGDDRLRTLDDEAFVRLLYRELLGRYEDPAGWRACLDGLRSGRRSRGWLYWTFRFSGERREHPPLQYYDVADDPDTERPRPTGWLRGRPVESAFRTIERSAVMPSELGLSAEQQSQVHDRLQALGYLD